MKLSGYQEDAVARLLELHKPTPTFAVYDVPGAGKTATAINALLRLSRFPALITVPAHLVLQWRSELLRWGIPDEEIGYCPRGMSAAERLRHLANGPNFQLVTYNMWPSTRYRDLLQHPSWGSYVFDESHRLRKGQKGKGGVWMPISQLRTRTRSTHLRTPLWLFSGTPIVKDATDTWPLLHLANPYRYTSRRSFALEMCKTSQTPYGLHVGPVRDPNRLHKLLAIYSIRRTWQQIPELKDLKRRDIELPVELTPKELARHRTIKRDYRDPATEEPLYSSSAMIHALRRLTIPAKVDALAEWLEDHPGKVIVFSWYKDSARMAFDRASRIRGYVSYIDGDTSETMRSKALELYRTKPDAVLVGTIGALETGLNLQHGYQIVFLEQHWLSTTNEQAVARVLRRGQEQPVLVFWLHCPKTYDMRVKRVADKREADIERALDGFLADEEWNE